MDIFPVSERLKLSHVDNLFHVDITDNFGKQVDSSRFCVLYMLRSLTRVAHNITKTSRISTFLRLRRLSPQLIQHYLNRSINMSTPSEANLQKDDVTGEMVSKSSVAH